MTPSLSPEEALRFVARYNGCSVADVERFARHCIRDGGTLERVYVSAWQQIQTLGACRALVQFLAHPPHL